MALETRKFLKRVFRKTYLSRESMKSDRVQASPEEGRSELRGRWQVYHPLQAFLLQGLQVGKDSDLANSYKKYYKQKLVPPKWSETTV